MSKTLARGENYSFRVNEKEKRFLDKKIRKSGLGRREYFLSVARDEQLVEYSNIEFLKELFVEIKKQGNNINQIAKQANSNEELNTEQIQRILKKHETILDKISEEIVTASLKGK